MRQAQATSSTPLGRSGHPRDRDAHERHTRLVMADLALLPQLSSLSQHHDCRVALTISALTSIPINHGAQAALGVSIMAVLANCSRAATQPHSCTSIVIHIPAFNPLQPSPRACTLQRLENRVSRYSTKLGLCCVWLRAGGCACKGAPAVFGCRVPASPIWTPSIFRELSPNAAVG
jgi:hypothetical protein